MEENIRVQWFPGHMAKTRRKIGEDLKLVDVVAEIVDARIPASSANPVLRSLIQSKPRVVLLNKSDMADAARTAEWVAFYAAQGVKAVPLDCKNGKGLPAFYAAVKETLQERIAAWTKKGMVGRPIRMMIIGIPNVGKSSLINRMLQGSRAGRAEVQDKPGVTRQNRWFTVGNGFELLDTPGVLWPKFEDPTVGEHLAFTGAVRDDILDTEGLAARLLETILDLYPSAVNERYKTELNLEEKLPGHMVLEQIGRKRGMLISGGEVNTERAAAAVLDEYRSGKLGRMTLERATSKASKR